MYLTGLTLYFIGYVAFEVPSNIVLKRTTPRIWLPTLTLLWGIVATLLGVVQNYAGYLTSRTGKVINIAYAQKKCDSKGAHVSRGLVVR